MDIPSNISRLSQPVITECYPRMFWFFGTLICEQASHTLHHINRAKLFRKNLPWLGCRISSGVWGQLFPDRYWSTWIGLKSRGPVPRPLDGEINLTQTSSCLTCDYGKAGGVGYIKCRNSVCCWWGCVECSCMNLHTGSFTTSLALALSPYWLVTGIIFFKNQSDNNGQLLCNQENLHLDFILFLLFLCSSTYKVPSLV